MGSRPKIVLAGGSGFIGRALTPRLVNEGYDVVTLTRGPAAGGGSARDVHWNARTIGPWATELDRAAGIVNLVGRTVDCRKTEANKREILESRVNSVAALAAAWKQCHLPPKVWILTGTAHIYGDTGDELLDESSPIGEGFAPQVGTAWEKALADADVPGCRKVILRISFVLGRNGGALRTLSRLAKCFLGGATGSGRQWISWIHEADLQQIILRALRDERMEGPYVVTAPNPVRNEEFMRELRRTLGRPWSPRVPEPIVWLGAWMMRTDPELALYGRRCLPTRLIREGFEFRFTDVRAALNHLLLA
jgi:uncharacterized protein (TIGR01777 family)